MPVGGDYSVGQITGAAPLASPALTGTPTAPTALVGTSTTQIATTAFVAAALPSVPVTQVFGRTGSITATSGDYTVAQVTGAASIASPTFTGVPAGPTATAGTNTTQLATTAFVATAIGGVGSVLSVFGRTGTVVASTGDYAVGSDHRRCSLGKSGTYWHTDCANGNCGDEHDANCNDCICCDGDRGQRSSCVGFRSDWRSCGDEWRLCCRADDWCGSPWQVRP